jgi:TonB family protein
MNQSLSVAATTTKPQLDNYYRWVEPDGDNIVYLKLETADRLQREVLNSIHASSYTENEVGGILLGRTEADEGNVLIFVDDIEPVDCEHGHEPFYAVRAKESVDFEEALARRTPSVVGYYRSHNRDGLYLSADDLQLLRCHFSGADSLFLPIKPLPGRTCMAGFFFWTDGLIQSQFTDSEASLIPLPVFQMGEGLRKGGIAGHIAAALPAPALPLANPARNHELRRGLVAGLLVAGVAGLVTWGASLYRERNAPEALHGKDGVAVQMTLQRTAHLAPIVRHGAGEIPSGRPGSPKAVRPVRDADDNAIHNQPKPPNLPPVSLPASANTASHSPNPDEPGPLQASRSLNTSTPTSTSASTPASTEGPLNPVQSGPVQPAIATPPPATPLPASENVVKAAEAPRAVSVPAPATSPIASEAHTFAGPQVIHRVAPAVPRGVGPLIATDVLVDVAVTIDNKGKVSGARVASTQGAGAGLLTIEALKAAQLFRFQPAQENGRNVASSMVLTFRFARTAK